MYGSNMGKDVATIEQSVLFVTSIGRLLALSSIAGLKSSIYVYGIDTTPYRIIVHSSFK